MLVPSPLVLASYNYPLPPSTFTSFLTHNTLSTESIIFRLEGLLKKENVVEGDVSRLRDKLMAIDSEYEEAKMGAEGGKVVSVRAWGRRGKNFTSLTRRPHTQPEGQAVISELLEKTHNLMNQVQNKL